MKNCPNCGKQIDSNARFCTYCGYKFNLQNNSNFNEPNNTLNHDKEWVEKKQQAKQFSSNYFSWLLSTIRNPRMFENSDKHFGLTSFIISLILFGIIIFEIIQNAINKGTYYGGSFFSGIMASNAAQSARAFIYFNILVLILLLLISVIVIPYVSRKITYIYDRESFKDYLNGLAAYSNLVILLELIVVTTLLLNITSISFIVFSFIPIIYSFAMCISILDGGKNIHDRFYGLFIAFITNGIVVTIIFSVMFKTLLEMLSTIGAN